MSKSLQDGDNLIAQQIELLYNVLDWLRVVEEERG